MPQRALQLGATVPEVRIVVCGSNGSGKTALISTLVSEAFPQTGLCSVLRPIRVPADVTPEGVPLTIVDTDERLGLHGACDVVVLVCLADQAQESVDAWTPKIKDAFGNVSILVAINKTDQQTCTQEEVEAIRKSPWIEQVVQCSAKERTHVGDVFYLAQKAVLFPIAPFMDEQRHDLSLPLRQCIQRIALICDADKDGRLTQKDMDTLYQQGFGITLSSSAFAEILEALHLEVSLLEYEDLVRLCRISVLSKGPRDMWQLLHSFGYGPHLQLRSDAIPVLHTGPDERIEFSQLMYDRIEGFFQQYTTVHPVLNEMHLKTMLSNCTEPRIVEQMAMLFAQYAPDGTMIMPQWLSMWTHYLFFHSKECVTALLYLGMDLQELSKGLATTRPVRFQGRSDTAKRRVFHILAVGSRSDHYMFDLAHLNVSHETQSVCIPCSGSHGYIIVTRIRDKQKHRERWLKQYMPQCDLLLHLVSYHTTMNDPECLDRLSSLLRRIPEAVPQTAAVLEDAAIQAYSLDAIRHADDPLLHLLYGYRLQSVLSETRDGLSQELAISAAHPKQYLIQKPSTRRFRRILLFGGFVAASSIIGYLYWKKTSSHRQPLPSSALK